LTIDSNIGRIFIGLYYMNELEMRFPYSGNAFVIYKEAVGFHVFKKKSRLIKVS